MAVIGTFSALALTLGLSWIVAAFAKFSGYASEEAVFVSLVDRVDIGGLILAGAVLGAIGALDDITVTQASTVIELHDAGATSGAPDLYRRGLRVGRDHIAATVNTLFLAYAGAGPTPNPPLHIVRAPSRPARQLRGDRNRSRPNSRRIHWTRSGSTDHHPASSMGSSSRRAAVTNPTMTTSGRH